MKCELTQLMKSTDCITGMHLLKPIQVEKNHWMRILQVLQCVCWESPSASQHVTLTAKMLIKEWAKTDQWDTVETKFDITIHVLCSVNLASYSFRQKTWWDGYIPQCCWWKRQMAKKKESIISVTVAQTDSVNMSSAVVKIFWLCFVQ